MSELLSDLRYGFRILRRQPGFTCIVVLVLALGVGANTAIFGLIQDVLLRPLSYAEPDRLVRIDGSQPGDEHANFSYPDFVDLRERARQLDGAVLMDVGDVVLTEGEQPRRLTASRVTPGYFELLGVSPVLGRAFRAEEEEYGNHRVVVLAWELFASEFGADESVVGTDVELWGEYHYTVVGVLPPGFEDAHDYVGLTPQLWRPLTVHPEHMYRSGHSYDAVLARLAPGVDLREAQGELDQIAAALEAEYPESNFERGMVARPLWESKVTTARPALLLLAGAVLLVLLTACANVTNMLLARSAAREREFAVRRSLGAGRGRLVRQILTEAALMAAAGGLVGWLLASWTHQLLAGIASRHLPRVTATPFDLGTAAFVVGLSLVAGLLCGVVPALHALRADGAALRQGSGIVASGVVRRPS